MIEELKNSFVRLHQILELNEEHSEELRKEILDLCNYIDESTLHAREDIEYSLLLDWIVTGYLKLMDLFFFSWNNRLFCAEGELKREFEEVIGDLVARCDANKIDPQSILNLAYDLTNLQNLATAVYKDNKKSFMQ